ncbi:MAG: hypothetical protein EA381_04835 [Planctomycetaceae bacterium]|nr:MAG: hypothetical protein EA381_04835 [Planctomycetaceae bacterium]
MTNATVKPAYSRSLPHPFFLIPPDAREANIGLTENAIAGTSRSLSRPTTIHFRMDTLVGPIWFPGEQESGFGDGDSNRDWLGKSRDHHIQTGKTRARRVILTVGAKIPSARPWAT